jgi:iron(III) transport system ATP-binding protein
VNSLSLRGVEKSFGAQWVLRGIDLEVRTGSLTAILGPSGSGKTTLLRIVAGFERAGAGTITLGGRLADGPGVYVPSEQRRIGYVPQEGSLFPHMSVAKNIAFGLGRHKGRSARVGELLELVGLSGLEARYPHELSGGQQQRVALARALAVDPGVVLLDEPFSALDANLRASLRADVHSVLRQSGATVVLVTHDQDEALSMADRVAVISEGAIRQYDTPQRLYQHPVDQRLASFLGEANLVEATIEGGMATTAFGRLAVDVEPGGTGRCVVLVRPEQIVLHEHPGADELSGRVLDYQFYGHDAVVRIAPDGPCGATTIIARQPGSVVFEPGTRVGLSAAGEVRAWAGEAPSEAEPAAQ